MQIHRNKNDVILYTSTTLFYNIPKFKGEQL